MSRISKKAANEYLPVLIASRKLDLYSVQRPAELIRMQKIYQPTVPFKPRIGRDLGVLFLCPTNLQGSFRVRGETKQIAGLGVSKSNHDDMNSGLHLP